MNKGKDSIMTDFKPYQIICQHPIIENFIFQQYNKQGLEAIRSASEGCNRSEKRLNSVTSVKEFKLRDAMKVLYELRVIIGWSNDLKSESPTVLSNGPIKNYIYGILKINPDNSHILLCAIVATIMHAFNNTHNEMAKIDKITSMETIALYLNTHITVEEWHRISHLYYAELLL